MLAMQQKYNPVIALVKKGDYNGLKDMIAAYEKELKQEDESPVRIKQIIAECINSPAEKYNMTALHHIAINHFALNYLNLCSLSDTVKMMNLLIAKGADVNAVDSSKNTPLQTAETSFPLACATFYLADQGKVCNSEEVKQLINGGFCSGIASGEYTIPTNLFLSLTVQMGLLDTVNKGVQIQDKWYIVKETQYRKYDGQENVSSNSRIFRKRNRADN